MRPHYATEKDWPEVEALLSASSLALDGMHEHLTQFLVVRDKAGLLGCAGIERYETTCVLLALAVVQRARSAGLGELLIAAIVADLRLQGVESIVLQTRSASGYFARLGFTQIDISELPQSVRPAQAFGRDRNDIGMLMQSAL
ncbi:GNAT family N-acetyltransferase [Cupriavidus lacunae]|uniref:GNAT family N-acetyltransferase n=1 Tax=Cupriavidus lacunae TaxID=2666307 RepID=A0A370P0P9_9BURK|nr:GNAT family N-acetyltransferase [Cupriavidus lacunae]RDK11441.1 GNAT family N-acetyltransferase [Cupriavidus lacunae]